MQVGDTVAVNQYGHTKKVYPKTPNRLGKIVRIKASTSGRPDKAHVLWENNEKTASISTLFIDVVNQGVTDLTT